MDQIGWKRKEKIDSSYLTIEYGSLVKGKKVVIPSAESGLCRYCGKKSPEVSFKTEAHAFPGFIGNNSLFSSDECDSCNELFSRVIEDDLANYIGVERTLKRIRGRNKIPKYKSLNGTLEISADKSSIDIRSSREDGNVVGVY
ncbi:HNH endonuclease [Chromobacterium sp. IIBBL 290-4]|uniref:HNH endonuclease n=1 Tax=Chromobacterium sp. IIBBL 290-4 TaxID=2953890 RepID=UPI0020B6D755|nr:HNH endonuclease [Chromobacterium sp. IIBBL 290-4]UTH74772.1 HNH endonuclease [Chromobacterium sp. IIBBL 290-4]